MNLRPTKLIRSLGVLAAVAMLGLAACASPPSELVEARQTYEQVAQGPAAEYAPAELQAAKQALEQAEEAYEDEGNDPITRSLAYRAQRKAQLAAVEADIFLARQNKRTNEQALLDAYEESRQQLKGELAQRRAEMVESQNELALERERLEQARQNLEQARQRGDMTEQELQEQRQMLEQRQQALAQREQQLAVMATELANEREQRQQMQERLEQARSQLEEFAKVEDRQRNMIITVPGEVLFEVGEYELRPVAKQRLSKVAQVLLQDKERKIVVEGHTDAQGSEEMNQQLSQNRAQAVREYFISQGIAADRIEAVGRGEGDPLAPNETPTGRATNRRVEIIVEGAGTAALQPGPGAAQQGQQGQQQ